MSIEIQKWLGLARIDIKNFGADENDVKVMIKEGKRCNIWKAPWFSKNMGAGYTLETDDKRVVLELECVGEGNLLLRLMGVDRRILGKLLPIWIDCTRLTINGRDLFVDSKSVWHNKPYEFTTRVHNGDRFQVEVSWENHEYKADEMAELFSAWNNHQEWLDQSRLLEEEEKEIIEKRKRNKGIKEIVDLVHITKKWAAIPENDLEDLSQIIEKFDEGYTSVSIVDENNKFMRIVNKYQFKKDFPKNNYTGLKNLYIEYDKDEERLKWNLADLFLNTPRQEIPILKRGKIYELGRCCTYFDMNENWDSMQVFKYDWRWIDENVAKEVFSKYRKVLISSDAGILSRFRDAFSKWLDIDVYSDRILDKCFAGEYDLVIDGSHVFFQMFPAKYTLAHRLYRILLFETVRRWLYRRGISVHVISSAQVVHGIENRLNRMGELAGGTVGFVRDGETPYFILDEHSYDTVVGKGNVQPNFHSGRRCVAEAKNCFENGIYFYGPCTAVGYATYSPDKTIESYLQEKINKDDLNYHVINCGTEAIMGQATSINWLYRLMDTPMHSGDIAIVFDTSFDTNDGWIPVKTHRLIDPFIMEENKEKRLFADPALGHINVEGYKIAAEYIYSFIQKDIKKGKCEERKSFISTVKPSMDKNSNIGKWLERLPKNNPIRSGEIGAIVMKANPVTKGHIHLIQEAMKRCDFLYVFIESEEKQLLSPKMVKDIWQKCIKNKNNVIVCKLGRCMRESYRYNAHHNVNIGFVSTPAKSFDPVADTYTFARYIAPKLRIKKRFVGEELFDEIKSRYNILKHEILLEEGIEWVELPRKKLDDGRDIITSKVRELWEKEGWKACKDYLPMEEISILEQNG